MSFSFGPASVVPPVPVAIFYGLLVREQDVRRAIVQQQLQQQQQLRWMPLPLSSVHVSAQTFDFCSEVTVTQTYTNATPHLLESEYVFPLDENSAVCAFSAELNGRIIHGLVKEKNEARKEFVAAKARGHSTMLLEQKQENVFKITIGNLEPHSECKIKLTYITTLDLEGKANRLVIPSVVAPKYNPNQYFRFSESDGLQSTIVASVPYGGGSLNFFQSMTAQYMGQQPVPIVVPVVDPASITVTAKQQVTAPQRFSMQIEVLMPSEIVSITSESHQNQIHVLLDPIVGGASADAQHLPVPHHATIRFGMNADGSEPSVWPESLGQRDFVLKITQRAYLEARAVLEVDPATGSQAVQLAFCPQSLDLMDASSLQVEIIFLIDQSGSMSGGAISGVRSCLAIFLRSLPVACKFNLVSFGSTYRKLFPSSQRYSEQSIAQALAYASNIQADLGGTEILPPLQHLFESSRDVNYPRQIFLLTDGQVTNTQQLVDLTREHSYHTRLFTFGLGGSVDRHLVKSLASAGRGECEFVSGGSSGEATQELNAKVMRNLIRAMQPSLTDVKVDWSSVGLPASSGSFLSGLFGGSRGSSVQQCPEQITPIFPPNREIIYALGAQAPLPPIGGPSDQIVNIIVSAQSNRPNANGIQGRMQWSIPLNLSRPQMGTFVHRLAARARIGEIQNWTQRHNHWKDQKSEVLKLAIKHQLLSNFTSFIIVDSRKIKKPKQPKKSELAQAQVGMFNAFMSSQTQPGAQINANGFAFQNVGAVATAPAMSAPADADDDEWEDEECEYEANSWAAPAAPMPTRLSSSGPAFSFGAPQQQQQQQQQSQMSGFFGGSSAGFGSSSGASFGAAPARSFGGDRGGSRSSGGALCGSSAAKPCAPSSSSSFSFGAPPPPPPSAAAPPSFSFGAPPAPSADMFSEIRFSNAMLRSVSPRSRNESKKESADGLMDLLGASLSMRKSATSSASSSASQPMSSNDLFDGASFASTPAAAPVAQSITLPRALVPASGASASTLFTVLVQMSCIDGTWNLSDEFLTLVQQIAQATGQSPVVIQAAGRLTVASLTNLSSTLSLSVKALATLVALWCLRVCFAPRETEWAMMAGKAKGALRNSHQVPVDQIDQVTAKIGLTDTL